MCALQTAALQDVVRYKLRYYKGCGHGQTAFPAEVLFYTAAPPATVTRRRRLTAALGP